MAPNLLGLFPAFRGENGGGIQASGELAWSGLSAHCETGGEAELFCYDAGAAAGAARRGGAAAVRSKFEALCRALSIRRRADTILVWHIGLLKLLPFLRRPDARVVLFLHGVEAWRRQDLVSRGLLRRVDQFLSNSDYTWERFARENPDVGHVPHRTVHLGIGSPAPAPPAGLASPPAVLMLGRLLRSEDYKGHREMVAAWPEVQRREQDAELWIVGDGDLREDLERIAGYGRAGRVRFWGRVSEPEKQDLLNRCRCLALPSRGEGFGLVYLEAMRLGKPCLVSTRDAGREVVSPPEAGLAADPSDSHSLAEAVCQLLARTREGEERVVRARRRYEENFTARHFQERLAEAVFGEGGAEN